MEQFRVPRGIRRFHVGQLPDEWILALILHANLAWVISAVVILIGHLTKAPWRLTLPETGNESGYKLFWLAFIKVLVLWFRIFLINSFCELMHLMAWVLAYILFFWPGERLPRLLPLIDHIFLAMGLDLIIIVRRHYQ